MPGQDLQAADLQLQGTVAQHDPATGCGQVLLDDGSPLPYDADAFGSGGARLLRLGQRVALTVADGRVARVSLPPFI